MKRRILLTGGLLAAAAFGLVMNQQIREHQLLRDHERGGSR